MWRKFRQGYSRRWREGRGGSSLNSLSSKDHHHDTHRRLHRDRFPATAVAVVSRRQEEMDKVMREGMSITQKPGMALLNKFHSLASSHCRKQKTISRKKTTFTTESHDIIRESSLFASPIIII